MSKNNNYHNKRGNSQKQKETNKRSAIMRFVDWVNGGEIPANAAPEPVEEPAQSTRPPRQHPHHAHPKRLHRQIVLYRVMSVLICVSLIGVLMLTVAALPTFGRPDNPASNEVVERYLEKGLEETGAINAVAGMILDYRAFDTFGESTVLFLAVTTVVMLLRRDKNNISEQEDREIAEDERIARASGDMIPKRMANIVVPMILLYGVYVVLNGHLSPGGGFSGGAIMGAGLILYAAAYGTRSVHRFFTFKTFTVISFCCLMVYASSKGYAFFTGANHIESGIPKGIPGAILSGGLILPLDICVGCIVMCTMYSFYSLFSKGDI